MGSYKIKKGNHYSLHWPKFHFGETNIKFKFKFGAGCWYETVVPDDYAFNKLCGLGCGDHHKNSVRVGWCPAKDINRIDLVFYLYTNGQRVEQHFATVNLSQEYEIEIDLSSDLVSFNLTSNQESVAIDSIYYKLPWFRWGAILFPYIGGQLPARANTYIDLTII